jgi:SAM-dependent methyltransferase
MREAALAYLACPVTRAPLRLVEVHERDGGHILRGTLATADGKHRYPIRDGVPRLVPGQVHAEAVATAHRFGEQWKSFSHMSSYQEAWLAAWLAPLGPDDFRGKVVFEGGCGKGRHSQVMGHWGVKDLVALDLGDAVDVAFAHTRELPNVHIVQGDLLQPPVRRGAFDVSFSVGVLHHLPDPRAGFEAVRQTVRPGGKVAVWVYGYENNEWIVRYVDPVRTRITSKLPPRLLQALTLPPAAALSAWTKLYTTFPGLPLPYADYMRKLGEVPLREVHNIVFDQLVPPLAFYLRRDEVSSWFDGLRDVRIEWHNKNSWRASATV